MQSLEGSLKRLNTDYIDLYWLHAWDFMMPIEEVMRAFDDMAVMPWSPLGGGVLTGKYNKRNQSNGAEQGRLETTQSNISERNKSDR